MATSQGGFNTERGSPMSAVDHPPHYNQGKIEPIAVIEDWQLDFCLGNTVKYIARSPHKGSELEDLEKAAWYLARKIEQIKTLNTAQDEAQQE